MIGQRGSVTAPVRDAALSGWRALRLALVWSLFTQGTAIAQATGYGGYGAQQDPAAQTANAYPGSGQYNSQYDSQSMGGAGQATGSAIPAYSAGTVQSQAGPGSDPFSPMYIQEGNFSNPPDAAANRVNRPQTDGRGPSPVFLRPAPTPGQYEIFQKPAALPSEFEAFVQFEIGRPLPRFGSSLLLMGARTFATAATTTVPPDYRLNPGDELLVGVTGSVEARLQLVIDTEGRVFIPRLGSVSLAGVQYGDLAATLTSRFSDQFKDVKLSVVISRLHGLNVYVTGYAVSPGSYTVSSLSTMVDAVLAAGGPAAGGSFRSIQLRRNGQTVSRLDLYDVLLTGDKSHDAVLQNGDVLNIDPVGPELAVVGSVNAEAIYEARPGETLGDMIRYAGGLNSLADESRVVVTRLADLDKAGSQQLDFAKAQTFPAERGDILRILTLADVSRPLERHAILATIEGEVDHPGRYYLRPGSTVADLLSTAGGMTSGAFVFGTELDRESIRRQQQISFTKAIENLELAAAAVPLQSQNGTSDRAAASAARGQSTLAIIQTLKDRKPDGRLVIPLTPDTRRLPGEISLEDNDRLYIPPMPKTVGVFGAVYQTGSFLYHPGTRLGDYLRLAGGPQRIAARNEIFVVRANGSVLATQQGPGFAGRPALPGDVLFVPVRTGQTAFEKLLDVTAVVYEFGVGVLTLKALGL